MVRFWRAVTQFTAHFGLALAVLQLVIMIILGHETIFSFAPWAVFLLSLLILGFGKIGIWAHGHAEARPHEKPTPVYRSDIYGHNVEGSADFTGQRRENPRISPNDTGAG